MSMIRTRWAAVGAAVAVSLGAGGLTLVDAAPSDGGPVTIPIQPCRLVDTRPDRGIGGRTTPLGPAEAYTVQATGPSGNCNISNSAVGLVLNVTADQATEATNLRLYPTGLPVPTTSNLNPRPGAPPTPNAVTVALSNTHEFDIRNAKGSVHVIIDVTAYLIDHHHDDRYLKRADWSIEIAPSDLMPQPDGPVYGVHDAKGLVGMGFGDDTYCCAVRAGFRLPEGYDAGSQVAVDIDWTPASFASVNPVGCAFVFRAPTPEVSRSGAPMFDIGTSWADGSDEFVVTSAGLNDLVATTKRLHLDGNELEPGDRIHLYLFRKRLDADDTCEGVVTLQGLTVHEG